MSNPQRISQVVGGFDSAGTSVERERIRRNGNMLAGHTWYDYDTKELMVWDGFEFRLVGLTKAVPAIAKPVE